MKREALWEEYPDHRAWVIYQEPSSGHGRWYLEVREGGFTFVAEIPTTLARILIDPLKKLKEAREFVRSVED